MSLKSIQITAYIVIVSLAITSCFIVASDDSEAAASASGSCGDGVVWNFYSKYPDGSSYPTYYNTLVVSSTGGDTVSRQVTLGTSYRVSVILIQNGITNVDLGMFKSLYSVDKIVIGKDVETIIQSAPVHTRSFQVDTSNVYFSVYGDVLYNKEITQMVCYPYASYNSDYSVPATVTSLSWASGFSSTGNLTSITLGGGLEGAFSLRFKYGNLDFTAEDAALLHGQTYKFEFKQAYYYEVPNPVRNLTNNKDLFLIKSDAWDILPELHGKIFADTLSYERDYAENSCYNVTVTGLMSAGTSVIEVEGTPCYWEFTTDGTDYLTVLPAVSSMAHDKDIFLILFSIGTAGGAFALLRNRRTS